MTIKNPYQILGIVLAIVGAILAPVFYFIVGSPPLTATAISAIILGFTCIAIANSRPYLSPEAAKMLLKTGMENTTALLEELGLQNKATYLPSTSKSPSRALVPLMDKAGTNIVPENLPKRLIVRYGPNPEDMAIAVTTPGNVSIELLENKPGPTADEMETALNYLLTGVLDIAHSVSVHIMDSKVEVKINAPKMSYENVWYYKCLGSPIASITAAVVAEAFKKPLRITEEKYEKNEGVVVLEILSR
jgi:hypothetical protein